MIMYSKIFDKEEIVVELEPQRPPDNPSPTIKGDPIKTA